LTDVKREHKAYYVRCPQDYAHFILANPTDPTWEKNPPKSPLVVECRGCGEHYSVTVTQPWKLGYVSLEELDQSVAHQEPTEPPNE
jgi:hypothetical protein